MRLNSVVKPVYFVTGISRDNSYVDIDDGHLHVKMGPWFDERLPIDAIDGVEPSDWPWWGGLGVKLGPKRGGVGVVGAYDGVLAIRFKEPQRVKIWVLVSHLKIDCSELRVALEEPDAFMRAIGELRGGS